MFNAENKTLKLSCGAEMYYAKFGKGKRELVMIPGLNIVDMRGTAANLAYFYRKLTKDFTVYIFDRRSGCDRNATIRSMADDLADALKTLGLEKCCVAGVSQGGMIAQYLTLYHPELVKKLFLGVTAARTNPVMTAAVDEWEAMAENGDLKGILTKTYDKMYTESQMKIYRLVIPAMMHFTKFMSVERFADHAKAIYSLDCIDMLKNIKCPTLVIGAENDKITTAQASREIAAQLGCECHILHNEGHAAYLSKKFNKMMYDFFMEKNSPF